MNAKETILIRAHDIGERDLYVADIAVLGATGCLQIAGGEIYAYDVTDGCVRLREPLRRGFGAGLVARVVEPAEAASMRWDVEGAGWDTHPWGGNEDEVRQ